MYICSTNLGSGQKAYIIRQLDLEHMHLFERERKVTIVHAMHVVTS